MKIKEAFSYDDVLLVPQKSDIEHRKEIEIGNHLDENIYLSFPIIASPMDTISETDMVMAMAKVGGLAIIHRFNTIENQCKIVKSVINSSPIAAAIGITGDFYERAVELVESGVNILVLDVAHGHHESMRKALKKLRDFFGNKIHLMAGNVATVEGYDALHAWGADSVRVGIGAGSICSTRLQTGHGVPTLQSIYDCAHHGKGAAAIIADGGSTNSGDVVKALAAGADFVLAGSLFAGTTETPGKIIQTNQGEFKKYRGQSSFDAQMDWRGTSSTPEGISTLVPYRGNVERIIEELRGGIQSGLSYSGARNIKELQAKAIFIRQTLAGQKESYTHILSRK